MELRERLDPKDQKAIKDHSRPQSPSALVLSLRRLRGPSGSGDENDQGQAGLKGETGAQALSNWKQCVSKLYEAKDKGLLKVRSTNE